MRRRDVLLMLPAGTLMACTGLAGPLALAPNSTLIVTRHADRDGENLNAAGKARAKALVKALEGVTLDAIYAPGIQRNLDSAGPLATARGLSIQRIPQEAPTSPLVIQGAGKSVIWVGNKGNINTIYDDLKLSDPRPLAYGDLHFIRSNATGVVTIERRRYGAA